VAELYVGFKVLEHRHPCDSADYGTGRGYRVRCRMGTAVCLGGSMVCPDNLLREGGAEERERAAWREKDPSSVDRAVALSKQSRSSYWMQLASNKYHGVDVSPKACPDDANVVPDTLG